MKNLPLFYYPSTWLWIDDDATFLNSMTNIYSEKNAIKSFNSARECLAFLQGYQPPLARYHFLTSDVHNENYSLAQRMPMDFDLTQLMQLAHDKTRHQEITVMVVDYNMPEMDGFTLATAARELPMAKIILTGNKDEHSAIQAFNMNLIHRFVQKGEPEMLKKIAAYVQELTFAYFQKTTESLLGCLEIDHKLPLSDPTFIKFFQDYCVEHHIVEYYLIDKQGSFLLLDADQKSSILVLHSDRSIDAWLTLYGDEKHLSQEDRKSINERKKIPFFGIGKETCEVDGATWTKHLYPAHLLLGRERYFWAIC